METNQNENIIVADYSEEMKTRYLEYAMSVIAGRALPDVKDGLKPVHLRILYAMYELGLIPDKPHRKSARIVGDVLGKYHPHGDTAVYDAMVRMAQDFNLRYPLVDGHGNFGSIDGDSPAAMRYTESKLSKLALEMLRDINKNTIDFRPNFDGEEQEPTVLPSRFPNLLANGSSGIAVGMATNIPSHNLNELINGLIHLIDNPHSTVDNLIEYIPSPDFATGGIITNPQDIKEIYETGRGSITIRSKYHIEENTDENSKKKVKSIVFTEIPYQTNKAKICANISDLIENKDIILKEVIGIRDESDKDGMRIVVDLKPTTDENKILSRLFKKTNLQKNFSSIFLVLVNNEPKVLNLKQLMEHYIDFQKQIITRRTQFDLNKSQARLHILKGLLIAIDKLDLTIQLIRSSKNKSEAKEKLIGTLLIDEKQAEAILDLRLQRLTNLETDTIDMEYTDLLKTIEYLNKILNNECELLNVLKSELLEIKEKYGDDRRTQLLYNDTIEEITKEDMIEDYSVTMVLTEQQYLKKTLKYSEVQKLKEDDKVLQIIQTNNKNDLLLFTNQGRVFTRRIYELTGVIECTAGGGYGEYIPNILGEYLEKNEKIIYIVSPESYDKGDMLYVFEDNNLARVSLSVYQTKTNRQVPQDAYYTGKKLICIQYITNDIEILYITKEGKILITNTSELNSMGTGGKKSEGKLPLVKVNTDKFKDNCIVKNVFDVNKEDKFIIKTNKKDIELNLQEQYDKDRVNYEYFSGNARSQGNFIYNCRQKDDFIVDIIKLGE